MRYYGGVYRASHREAVGNTRGFRRVRGGYSMQTNAIKQVFVKPLHRRAQQILSHDPLSHHFNLGEITMKITRVQMRSLPDFFKAITAPRRTQGRRHQRSTVLGIAAGAVLCGMRSYASISDWADSLTQAA